MQQFAFKYLSQVESETMNKILYIDGASGNATLGNLMHVMSNTLLFFSLSDFYTNCIIFKKSMQFLVFVNITQHLII